MKILQIYTQCLAQGSYCLIDQGEMVVIDPLRETKPYLEIAARENAQITHIFETHFHADFVSGHVSLSKKTGAKIIYGPKATPSFEAYIARDRETFQIGETKIKVLHTPGHTMESSCYLVEDAKQQPHAIFTGDTLFLGDVGRPDLAQKKGKITPQDLAGMLYDSIHNNILPLPDHITVYPGHGAGSSCGKNMMKETVDTLGNQKKVNYALDKKISRAIFIQKLTEDLPPPPGYFPKNVALNQNGYSDTENLLCKNHIALDPEAFQKAITENPNTVILDVRHSEDFMASHIPKSWFIGLDGSFAPWVGELLIDIETPILLVCPEDRVEEAITRLARVGFDKVTGYLKGGMKAWKGAGLMTESIDSVTPVSLEKTLQNKSSEQIFDVRREGEYTQNHIVGAVSTPLGKIEDALDQFPKEQKFFVHCAGGYRSVIASSILKSKGIQSPINIAGGFKGICYQTKISTTNAAQHLEGKACEVRG